MKKYIHCTVNILVLDLEKKLPCEFAKFHGRHFQTASNERYLKNLSHIKGLEVFIIALPSKDKDKFQSTEL